MDAPATGPVPFGTDRLETGAAGRLRLLCAFPKGWRPRLAASGRRAEHPGTAVEWQDVVYEVVAVETRPDRGVAYLLEPWRDDLTIRSLERYDAASETGRAGERSRRKQALRKRRLAILLSPLLGHLPGEVLERMEGDFGAPANAMTVISAFPLFVVGTLGLFGFVARVAGGSIAPLPEPSLPLSLYLALESSLRVAIVVTQSRPAGSIPGALAYEVWKRFASSRSGTAVASGGHS
jgi:hypothetical protein